MITPRSARQHFACAAIAAMLAACGQSQDALAQGAVNPSPTQHPSAQPPDPLTVAPPTPVKLNAAAEYDKGAALAAAGKLAEASAVFGAAHQHDPGEEAVAAAVEIFRDMDGRGVPADVVQRLFRAMEHANAQQWMAHDDVDEAIRLAPRYPRAHTTKAGVYVQQGPAQFPNAIRSLELALKIDPQFAETYDSRGAVRAEMGQFDAALPDYNRALELQPSAWYAYSNRGSAYANRNRPDRAVADYTKAHEMRPTDADTLLLRGAVYAGAQQWDAALADFEKVIALNPRHATAYYHRALAHQEKGNVEAALADYTRATELAPDDPAPLINRGLLYANRKEFDGAIGDYDAALKVAPSFALAHLN